MECGTVLLTVLLEQLLAGDAVLCPGNRGQPFQSNFLTAMLAFAEGSVVDSGKRGIHQSQETAFLRSAKPVHLFGLGGNCAVTLIAAIFRIGIGFRAWRPGAAGQQSASLLQKFAFEVLGLIFIHILV